MDSGAHFHKSDLQTHSPRDPAWSGPKPTAEDDRKAFAEKFVAACRAKGLEAVAMTDHHDLAFVDYVREAATNETDESGSLLPEEKRLVVFPGVELSLGVPCQALLVLDADFPSDRLPGVLAALSIDPADAAEASATTPQQLAHVQNFEELYELLDRNGWLKGRYAVFPHASDSGHKTLIRKGLHDKYKEMPCVGVYTDGDASKLGEGCTKILEGEDKAWGNKRVAVIQTSDARSDTFATLGKSPTWIKWAAHGGRRCTAPRDSGVDGPSRPSHHLDLR
jgi:chromosome segregation protein